MRMAITTDNHLDFIHSSEYRVNDLFDALGSRGYDILINLGDMTNGRLYTKYRGLDILLQDENCLYVLGNHDLWSHPFTSNRVPNEAFRWVIKWLSAYSAVPLETSFADHETFWRDASASCCIVGTMGFPDFEHPMFKLPKATYDQRQCTNDGRYMDLSKGWLIHTRRIIESFEKRLVKAMSFGDKDVVVATHYPIFDEQYKLSSDDISAYFFCHTLGELIKKVAKDNPSRRFWCIAGHAHEYCRGTLNTVADNIAAMGIKGDYGKLPYAILDTTKGFNQKVETNWIPEPCRMVVETVTHETRRID